MKKKELSLFPRDCLGEIATKNELFKQLNTK